MTQEQEAAEAVSRGIAWMEEKSGKPWDEISKSFDPPVVRSVFDCALAQFSDASYMTAKRIHRMSVERAADLGFTVRPVRDYCTTEERLAFESMWLVLQAEWERRFDGTGRSG